LCRPNRGSLTPKKNTTKFDRNGLIPIMLFSGIGLLVSIIAILSGVQGSWY
jgi:hypothetical protein